MPKAGNTFTVVLKKTHVKWGEHRNTNSRKRRRNEGYIPIPANYARGYYITNLHETKQSNVYLVNTSDGFLTNEKLKASGCSKKGDKYAKNLHGNNDLTLLGNWFERTNTNPGDKIEVKFVSPTEILLTKL